MPWHQQHTKFIWCLYSKFQLYMTKYFVKKLLSTVMPIWLIWAHLYFYIIDTYILQGIWLPIVNWILINITNFIMYNISSLIKLACKIVMLKLLLQKTSLVVETWGGTVNVVRKHTQRHFVLLVLINPNSKDTYKSDANWKMRILNAIQN